MDNDRRSHRTAVALFALAATIAAIAAFITTFEAADYRNVSNEAAGHNRSCEAPCAARPGSG
jgi:hypothetical protein